MVAQLLSTGPDHPGLSLLVSDRTLADAEALAEVGLEDEMAQALSAQFIQTGVHIKFIDQGAGPAVLQRFLDLEVLPAKGRELRQVGDTEDLMFATERPELLSHRKANPPADALINLIKN